MVEWRNKRFERDGKRQENHSERHSGSWKGMGFVGDALSAESLPANQ
jgi:hypothetical protein